jgi:hypothetical protein
VSKAAIVETCKQLVGLRVIRSLDAGTITIGVETIVAPTMNVVRRGILITSITKLGSRSDRISTRRKLNGSLTLPTINARVVGTPHMVFTNLIMTTHVNRNANRPPMSSMVIRMYKSVNATNPKRGY